MAQKSLPILNKVNVSMVWYSTIYSKYYKWISANVLYLSFTYLKILIKFNLFNLDLLWSNTINKELKATPITNKFFSPFTLYIVDYSNFIIIYNLYYKVDLTRFQYVSDLVLIKSQKSINKQIKKKNLVWLL